MTQNRLYFGYGSNLDWNDWVQYCEKNNANPNGLKEREPAWLVEHHLKFHYYSSGREGGAADVVPVNNAHATPGVLFDVDEEAWAILVRKEGAPNYYEEKGCLLLEAMEHCKKRQHSLFVSTDKSHTLYNQRMNTNN